MECQVSGRRSLHGVDHGQRTYIADEQGEGMPLDFTVPVYGLDELAVMRWWNGFNNGSQRWNLRNLNCTNVVYKVLHEGDLVASAEAQATIDSIFPFTPWWLERFAANVLASQPQSTHPEM
jgi:hypothetical protein